MELQNFFGLSTAIGSLPHLNTGEALNLIADYCKKIPHWPQLPKRSPSEGFITQYINHLITRNIIVSGNQGKLYFDDQDQDWAEKSLQFYEFLIQDDQENADKEFAFSPGSAQGFYELLDKRPRLFPGAVCLKGQLTGPVTAGFTVTDSAGKPSFYNPGLREILVKSLAAHGSWQSRRLQSTGLPAMVFIDEPALYTFGSSGTVGLGRAEIQEALGEVAASIRSQGAFSGVHCCAGIDWGLIFELPVDLVSFDAYEYFSSMQVYAGELDNFLRRGGVLAWGIVPASEQAWREDPASLRRLLDNKIRALTRQGVDENLLRRQLLITPACGAGSLSIDLAGKVYSLTEGLAMRLR